MSSTTAALTQADVLDAVFKVAAAGGAVLAALGASTAFFLKRYWDTRDKEASARAAALAAKEEQRTRERDILYQSLQWFEGGTQNRSIGIAVVNSSWDNYPEFRALWVEVFANQAIYLLAAARKDDKAHEQDNLRRLLELLMRQEHLLAKETRAVLVETMARKVDKKVEDGIILREDLLAKVKDALAALAPERRQATAAQPSR